jgi:AraC-like DNA-binding protein
MGAQNLINHYARALISSAGERGLPFDELCRLASVPPDGVADTAAAITPDVFGRITRTVKVTLGDEFCGFSASPCRSGTLPFILQDIIHEETLGSALERTFRFYHLVSQDITFDLHVNEDIAIFSLSLARPDLDRFKYLSEWWLMMWPTVSSWLIGEEIPILCSSFSHAPSVSPDEYADVFKGPCRFLQPEYQVIFSSEYLRRRIIRTLDDVERFFAPELQIDLVSIPGVQRTWKALLKTKMQKCLVKNEVLLSIEDLASEFNMSSQTLRRRLDHEGISFRILKEEVRREAILKWLAEPDIPIGEISLRAGFAERNGLVRAVRSWVGMSPKQFRCHAISEGAGQSTNH